MGSMFPLASQYSSWMMFSRQRRRWLTMKARYGSKHIGLPCTSNLVHILQADVVFTAITESVLPVSQVVVKSQILAGGRGLGKFKSGLQGGVHICSIDEAPKLAEQMLGQVQNMQRSLLAKYRVG